MSKKSKEKIGLGFWKTIQNNLWALGFVSSMSKSYVIHTFISSAFGYATWVFFSAYFIRYIVQAMSDGSPGNVYFYIGIVTVVMCGITIHDSYVGKVMRPLKEVELYQKMYAVFYKKAENVELACFEDTEFYNKYTMAVDNACEKMTEIVREVTNIICAIFAGLSTYILMWRMDPWMLVCASRRAIRRSAWVSAAQSPSTTSSHRSGRSPSTPRSSVMSSS